MLEVIDKGQCSQSHPRPLLFVHGGWHSAWCWDEHFLDFFADKGYRAVAISLRGHGGSAAPRPLYACSIADYVNDVRSVSDGLSDEPVPIGHSMGGLIVQKYLESRRAPAGVLLASAPPRGLGGATARFLRRHPWWCLHATVALSSLALVSTPARARELLFCASTPDSVVARYAARLQDESARAIALDMTLLNLPRPERVSTPLLVLGAVNDGSISVKEVQATARAYCTRAELFPDMGHDMMLEPGWSAVANRIHRWLGVRGL